MVETKFFNCLDVLKSWKNVSCILLPYDPELMISKYQNPDGLPTMKVAQPSIFTQPSGFHWFASGSPYAMKFLEIMRRVKETNLLHWIALVSKNRENKVYKKPGRVTIDDGIDSKHLIMILSFGLLISVTTFFIELIMFRRRFTNIWFKF